MTDIPPPAPVQLLPVRSAIAATYWTVFYQPAAFIRASIFPSLLSAVILLGWSIIPDWESLILDILAYCIDLVPYTFFGVAWHRLTLLGPNDGRPPLFPKPQRRHLLFLMFSVVVTLIYYIPLLGLGLVAGTGPISSSETGEILFWLLSVPIVFFVLFCSYFLLPYLMARLSFVFPAAAVDEEYQLRHSWHHTHKQGIRLYLLIAAAFLPGLLIVSAISHGVDAAFCVNDRPGGSADCTKGPVISEILSFALSVLFFVPVALMVTAVSISFRTITGWVPAGEATAQDQQSP